MRRIVMSAALIALSAVVATNGASASTQSANGRAEVPCFNDGLLTDPGYRTAPRNCDLLNRGRRPSLILTLEGIEWKRFGGKRAVGEGVNCNSTACYASTVTLRYPHLSQRCGGHLVYTRAKVAVDTPQPRDVEIGIRPC